MSRHSRSAADGRLWADAVEKVGATLPTRNNRIAQAGFLNRSCAFAARLESILLEDPLKIFFRQYRPKGDLDVPSRTWQIRCEHPHVRFAELASARARNIGFRDPRLSVFSESAGRIRRGLTSLPWCALPAWIESGISFSCYRHNFQRAEKKSISNLHQYRRDQPEESGISQRRGGMKVWLFLIASLSALFLSATADAQLKLDIAQITCKQFTIGDVVPTRSLSLFLAGYFYGKRAVTAIDAAFVINPVAFNPDIEKLKDYCMGHQGEMVMKAFEVVLGK